jgi:outer membrane lipoprotein-sorting protein
MLSGIRLIGVIVPLLCALSLEPRVSCAEPSAQQLLAVSNSIRNPGNGNRVMMSLVEYRDGKETDGMTLEIFTKTDSSTDEYRSLIRFVSPKRDADKLMLKNGNEFWFYDPSSKATIRIAPLQRLLGPVSNGDVVAANIAKDYRAELLGKENIESGDREKRDAYKLLLVATAPEVTYDRIEMWVDAENGRPIKAKFYAASHALLKTAYYRRYQTALGVERPTETVVIDGLDPKLVTIMRVSGHEWREIQEAWFQRSYLSQFKPD